jgi:tetratricopeptide (TPR) repeat protein
MKTWPLISWARYVCIAGLFVALIGIIPAVWFPLQLGKIAMFAVLMFVASLLFLLGGGAGGVQGKRGTYAAFLPFCIPLVYLISYACSTDRSVALFGYAIDSDTVLFALLCSVTFLFSFFLFRRFSSARALLGSVFAATVVALVFQFISILFGTHVLSALFSDASVNLVGKWNDLGLLAGLVLVLLIAGLELVPLTRVRLIAASVVTAVFVLFLALVQFPLAWGLVLSSCVVIGLWSFFSRPKHDGGMKTQWMRSLPWLPIAGIIISIIFLLWGSVVQGGLVKVFPVSSLEVRPSVSTTLDIVRSSHGSSFKRFLVGTGPNTFADDWFLYKPVGINQSQFWNLDFNAGYSTFATVLGSIGLLGALALLLPLILVLLGLVRVIRSSASFSVHERLLALSMGLASVYLWASAFMYVPSENMILLAFVLSGASFALSMKSDMPDAPKTRLKHMFFTVVIGISVLLLLATAGLIARRYLTEVYTNQGLYALQQNDINGALASANKALHIEQVSDPMQLSVLAGTAAMQALVSATTTPNAAMQQQFTALAQTTLANGQQSIARYPGDYHGYLNLGKAYDLLASVGVQGAYDSAKQMYAAAAARNPTDPEIPLNLGHLESVHGDTAATTAALQKALSLKSDYTDAILFVVQLDVTNKDIASAINAAKAAVNSAPGVASIWFELGLLYYSNNDTKDAIQPLEQAITLEPDYANAKYFLGLSYAGQNRTADAIQQFKDLEATNPDNSQVQLILSNLAAGKAPLDGTAPAQGGTTAPIQQ